MKDEDQARDPLLEELRTARVINAVMDSAIVAVAISGLEGHLA